MSVKLICASPLSVSVRASTPPSAEQKKRQASAVLSYSDMTHAMSTTSDGCSSFNCMSVLNDGIVNSYTFCPIAFQRREGLERLLRLAVAIWRGGRSLCRCATLAVGDRMGSSMVMTSGFVFYHIKMDPYWLETVVSFKPIALLFKDEIDAVVFPRL